MASISEGDGGKRVSPRLAGMRELEAEVRVCPLCKLARTRTNAVPGEGYVRAEVMFIGEGPGYHEDKQGRPFVGPAGAFLNELLDIAGLSRERVYIGNVVKCRPPNNRDPEPDEIAACAPYLERQIALINPKVIVTLGRFSMSKFFPGERISQIHGQARVVDGRLCVAMYHPAAGLHQASLADVIRDDFRKLPAFLDESRELQSPMAPMVETRREAAEEARQEVLTQSQPVVLRETPLVAGSMLEDASPGAIASEYKAPELPNGVPTPTQSPRAQEAAPAKPTRKNRKQSGPEYEQLTFFDL